MMQPLVLRLPEDIKRKLEFEAKRQKQTIAEVTRRAISLYLKGKPAQKNGITVLLEWTKKSDVGISLKDESLATTYKEHLYGEKSSKFSHIWKKKK